MMLQHTQQKFESWVETAKTLGVTSAENVGCPSCGGTALTVKDVEYGFGHEKGIQRYMSCGCCGAFVGVIVRRAGEHEGD